MKNWSSLIWLGAVLLLAAAGCAPMLASGDSVLRLESQLRGGQLGVEKLRRNPAPGLFARADDLSKEVEKVKGELSSLKRETRASMAELLTALDGMKGG